MSPEVLQRLKNWTQSLVTGPPRKVHTVIDTSHANLYGATMAITEKEPWLKFEDGTPLPPLWHLAYFVEVGEASSRRASRRLLLFQSPQTSNSNPRLFYIIAAQADVCSFGRWSC